MNRSRLAVRGSESERPTELTPHRMGVQVPHRVHPEVPSEGPVQGTPAPSGGVFRELAEQRESRIEEGHLLPDHVHMLISIPPKYSVAQVVGFIKGKIAIYIARVYAGRRRHSKGQHFWGRSLDPPLHPAAGSGGSKARAAATMLGPATYRRLISDTALSGSTFQASGLAGGT